MKIKNGDYCIAKQEQGKDYLFRALSDADTRSVEGVIEKNSHIQDQRHTLTVPLSDVFLNLGPDPRQGKVYGYEVGALFRKRLSHKAFGDIHFFYKPKREVLDELKASMDRVAAKLKRDGLLFLLDDIVFEVNPFNGEKYAGMFYGAKKKMPARIMIRPESMPSEGRYYDYVWFHELGHSLHLQYCNRNDKLNANWLKMYSTSIRVQTVKKDVSQKLLDLLVEGEERPTDFKRGLDEEDALSFKMIIRTIQQVNGLSIKDLDTLFMAEMKDEIKEVWPVRNIHHKELAPIISEYSTVNVRELFAEAFAFHMTGKTLPKQVVKLLERSIAYGKAAGKAEPDADQ